MAYDSKQYKKFAILFATFIVPLLFFLFLASGKVNFEKLPVLTNNVKNISEGTSFRNKVTVLSFVGKKPTLNNYQQILNLYQVIYKSTAKYKKFQIVTVVPSDAVSVTENLVKELKKVGAVDLPKWKFVSMPEEKIQALVASLETPYTFDEFAGIAEVFIIDEEVNLRGRTDDEDAPNGVLFGYKTSSISELKNKLREDLKVVFYESKFAVKEPKLN